MIQHAITRFLDTSHRRLILISATFGIVVLILLPLADRYFAQQKERDQLAILLKDARQVAASLDQFEERVGGIVADLDALEAKTVGPAELNAFRGALVRLARDSRCQIRRIDASGVKIEPWKGGGPTPNSATAEQGSKSNDFNLTSQTLSLQVTGSLSDVKALLEKLKEQGVLLHTKGFSIRPYGVQREEAILDLELILYSLERAKQQAV